MGGRVEGGVASWLAFLAVVAAAARFCVFASAALSAVATSSEGGALLLRKCCPEGRILDERISKCVPRNGTDASAEVERVNMSEVRRRGDLWWLDAAAVDSSSSLPFLDRQRPNGTLEFGTPLPCEISFAMLVASRSRRRRPRLLRNGTLLVVNIDSVIETSFPPNEYCADIAVTRSGAVPVFLACACLRHACVRSCCTSGNVLRVASAGRRSDAAMCVRDADVAARSAPRLLPRTVGHAVEEGRHPLRFYRPLTCDSGRTSVLVRASGDNDVGFGGENDVSARSVNIGDTGGRSIRRENTSDGGDIRTAGVGDVDNGDESVTFLLYDDGRVLLHDFGQGAPFDAHHVCVVPVFDGGTAVQACVPTGTAEAPVPDERRFSYAAALALGAAFIAVTLVCIALLPELRAGSYRAEVAHSACLLVGYVVLAASYLQLESLVAFCYVQAFLVQFSFLAAFFWLNVMCIDISWAFSGFRALPGSIADGDGRKFLYYSIYAWGCPTVICGITALLEFTDGLPDSLIRPDIGVTTCWFDTKAATLLYFYGPMALLLVTNVFLFAFTTWRIVQVHRDTEMLHRGESMRHDGNSSSSAFAKDRQRLILYVKLFCLMGVTWITEIISWAEGSDNILWYVTDLINLLRGVFIFVIFCCKPKVLRLLKRRLCEGWSSLVGSCGKRLGSSGEGVGRDRATSVWWGSLTSDPSKGSGTSSGSTCQTSVRMTEINGDAASADFKRPQNPSET